MQIEIEAYCATCETTTGQLLHFQWLKGFCEAVVGEWGSPDEARLERTPYPFQPQ